MRVHITLPEETVRAIDEIAGKRGRSKYITEAVTAAAKRDRLLQVIREGAGILDPEKYPYWSTREKTSQWIRELRDTPSEGDPIERVLAGRQRPDRLAGRKAKGPATAGAPRKGRAVARR